MSSRIVNKTKAEHSLRQQQPRILNFKAITFKIYKKDTHQNIPLGMQPKRKQMRESKLTSFMDPYTVSKSANG